MKKSQKQNPHLGEFIARLQCIVPVDGHILTEKEICSKAHLSPNTLGALKKGWIRICTPIMPSCASISRPVVTVRSLRRYSFSRSCTAVWKPISGCAMLTVSMTLSDWAFADMRSCRRLCVWQVLTDRSLPRCFLVVCHSLRLSKYAKSTGKLTPWHVKYRLLYRKTVFCWLLIELTVTFPRARKEVSIEGNNLST